MSNPTKYSGCKEATGKTNEAFELDFLPGKNSADSAKGNITQRCQNEIIYEEEVDFETALEKTGFGKFNIFLLLLSFPASCASTFDTASLPYVLPTASCDLNLTGYDRGLLNGAIYTGMLTSSFIWGSLSDTFGRQKLLAVGYLLDACFSIGASLSQSKWAMFAFKFLSGCAIAGPFSMIMTYMSEMFSKKYRDSIVLSSGIYMSLGGVIQPMIAIALIPKTMSWEILDGGIVICSWRIFLILSAVPALISGILTAFCVESPKFLLAKGNKTKALQTFQYMYSVNTGKPRETYPVKSLRNEVQTQNQRDNNSSSQSFVKTIGSAFTHPHLKHTFLCCGLQFLALNSLNTIRLWLPLLFHYIESIGGEPLNTCEAIARNDGPQPTDCSKVNLRLCYVFNN
uniref:Major facilitator superfamily (MFS) profile domain-containing protein n=1 Tax=Clastoptera arizonana TaxID=38151 RepID=A0A1B6DIX7_9HEMI